MLPNIHILGIQGSGKGTQSQLLVQKYNLLYVPSGQLFRDRATINDERGQSIASMLSTGELLPTNYLVDIIKEHLEGSDVNKGLLGDGAIRSVDQYETLQPIWNMYGYGEPYLIALDLDEKTAIDRIEHRRQESLRTNKPLRPDDDPIAIRERFRLFREVTTPVINLFNELGRSVTIDAHGSVEEINLSICEAVERIYPELKPS